jgi:hypothetical protein
MIEIRIGIAAHSESFHDRPRALVRRRREGYDFGESEGPEPVAERQSGRLRGVAFSPLLEGETPADFHAGRETDAESGSCQNSQSGETDERRDVPNLNGPKAKAVLAEMLPDAVDHRVALGSTEAAREELHHPRIAIHGGKGLPVLVAPWTQADAAAGQCHEGVHCRAILSLKAVCGEAGAASFATELMRRRAGGCTLHARDAAGAATKKPDGTFTAARIDVGRGGVVP